MVVTSISRLFVPWKTSHVSTSSRISKISSNFARHVSFVNFSFFFFFGLSSQNNVWIGQSSSKSRLLGIKVKNFETSGLWLNHFKVQGGRLQFLPLLVLKSDLKVKTLSSSSFDGTEEKLLLFLWCHRCNFRVRVGARDTPSGVGWGCFAFVSTLHRRLVNSNWLRRCGSLTTRGSHSLSFWCAWESLPDRLVDLHRCLVSSIRR